MFCPKCGEPMTLTPSHASATFRCVGGDMQLSRKLHDALCEVFVARTRRANGQTGLASSGPWYCPGCGVPMSTAGASVQYPACAEHLEEFIYALIERHPHLTRLLLTVAERQEIPGRGVIVTPPLPTSEVRPRPFSVELHKPDGSIGWASASVSIPFVHPPPPSPLAVLLLQNLREAEVPVGTAIWLRT